MVHSVTSSRIGMPLALSSNRHRTAGASNRRVTDNAPFVTESQATLLNKDGLNKLRELKNFNQKTLNDRILAAFKYLETTAETINDRGFEERTKFNHRKRKANEDGTEIPSDATEEYEALQRKIDEATKALDKGVRQMVDDRVWLEGIPNMVEHVTSHAKLMPETLTRPARPLSPSDDNEGESCSENATLVEPDPSETPTALLHAALSTHTSLWNHKSLTERYADDSDYKGFKRMVWECNHQSENGPPMPHSSLWFAAEEGRGANSLSRSQTLGPTQSQSMTELHSDADSDLDDALVPSQRTQEGDSDIEIQAERIRLTCPITLLPFKEPLTSQRCPHSFERDAILSILRQSATLEPLTATQQAALDAADPRDHSRLERQFLRARTIQCPECTIRLCEADLRPDPVLKRKVKRQLERQRREDGGGDEGDDDRGPRQNIVTLGSSPYHSARKQRSGLVKNESARVGRREMNAAGGILDVDEDINDDDDQDGAVVDGGSFVVPQTQLSQRSRTRRTVADDDDDDDMYG